MDIDCSVIIPAFNSEKTVIACLNSLQDAENSKIKFEILVVNDGSTDNTSRLVSDYAKLHKTVRLIEKENGGVSSARNEGIHNALGKYIYFLDSDDEVELGTLEKMVETAGQHDCSMVIADYKTQNTDSGQITVHHSGVAKNTLCDKTYIKNEIYPLFFTGDSAALSTVWNKLFLTEIIKKHNIMFDEARCHGEDWAFCMDFFECTERMYALDDTVLQYNLNGTQTYQKYESNLEYCLIDGYIKAKRLNDKYCGYSKKSYEYSVFMERFYYRILNFIQLDVSASRKRKFLYSREVRECFKYLMFLSGERLNRIGFSRLDKVAFLLLYIGASDITLKHIYKIGG